MIKVSGLYQWQEGAHFNHDYYSSTHMRIARDALSGNGLLRLESDRLLNANAPVPGEIIAASHAYFRDLKAAQAAMAIATQTLMEDLPKYTDLKPQIRISLVTSHLE
ncbi:hypothetical protein BH11PSE11_BH11PSE11_13460 [soil metagenome]